MAARITMSTTPDGEVEIWANAEGRDLLVRGLTALSETSDHFHPGAFEGSEIPMSDRAYRPTDTIIQAANVLFRPDEWDRAHFPHVMAD